MDLLLLLHFLTGILILLCYEKEWSINEENAPVALWDLIGRHAVVLLPLSTADQQLQMAHLLIRTITQETQESEQTQLGYAGVNVISHLIE